MIASAELAVQRLLTKAFLDADYMVVTLYRSSVTDDGAGGTVTGPPAPLPPQRLRLIPLGDGAQERMTTNGTSVTPSYMLLGLYDADMQRGDEFTVGGRRYQIVFLNENQQYEKKGEVAYRGE